MHDLTSITARALLVRHKLRSDGIRINISFIDWRWLTDAMPFGRGKRRTRSPSERHNKLSTLQVGCLAVLPLLFPFHVHANETKTPFAVIWSFRQNFSALNGSFELAASGITPTGTFAADRYERSDEMQIKTEMAPFRVCVRADETEWDRQVFGTHSEAAGAQENRYADV